MTTLDDLPLIASGKVREMYDLSAAGDDQAPRLLMVASDRISTYDVVHPTPIPDKGKVLTGLSAFWFQKTSHIVANHLISVADGVPLAARGRAQVVAGLSTARSAPVSPRTTILPARPKAPRAISISAIGLTCCTGWQAARISRWT